MSNQFTAPPPPPPAWNPPAGLDGPTEERVRVRFGTQDETFLKGHALSPAEILDAMDGYTIAFWTPDTHTLYRNHQAVTDLLTRIVLEDGDEFDAAPIGSDEPWL